MVEGCDIERRVLNPHGSDETRGKKNFRMGDKPVLNPHGSDETGCGVLTMRHT